MGDVAVNATIANTTANSDKDAELTITLDYKLIFIIIIIMACIYLGGSVVIWASVAAIAIGTIMSPQINKLWNGDKKASSTEHMSVNKNPLPYGEDRATYVDGYSLPYPKIVPLTTLGPDETSYNIDNMNTRLARERERTKKCSDGWASKDANYYRYHFADELDYEEKRPWWGRADQ